MPCERIWLVSSDALDVSFWEDKPVLAWLVKYSVAMANRCRGGPDGNKGRKFARSVPHFVEKILFVIFGVTMGAARVEPRWEVTGVTSSTFRTLRRREATERVDLTFLNAVSAKPWDGPKSAKDVRVVLLDVSSLAVMAEAEAIGKTRRL